MKTVCLDFDGVLNAYTGWQGEDELFRPREGAREFVQALLDRGYRVVIHTTRRPPLVYGWLTVHEFPDGVLVSNTKIPAVAYIDDRGITFRGDYDEILQALETFQPWWEPSAIPAEG